MVFGSGLILTGKMEDARRRLQASVLQQLAYYDRIPSPLLWAVGGAIGRCWSFVGGAVWIDIASSPSRRANALVLYMLHESDSTL